MLNSISVLFVKERKLLSIDQEMAEIQRIMNKCEMGRGKPEMSRAT